MGKEVGKMLKHRQLAIALAGCPKQFSWPMLLLNLHLTLDRSIRYEAKDL